MLGVGQDSPSALGVHNSGYLGYNTGQLGVSRFVVEGFGDFRLMHISPAAFVSHATVQKGCVVRSWNQSS